ncbi:TrbG/VirB9 family P-type conjugative transfer protein [Phenylobacterium montanum]|uniref:TrbG/VirB9 family P-type conjugative transfer protein n=1 Tax=Phenylobacterium montanum TaxID=2823693 RepID=A0A975G3E0_9CAUL|nr:TrbG/VirB9 family P-type conjugative transfer protein [Caulobacter sp. S6]QUD89814.1 TrbG/VirB9 family P-type conjugative transfer protein [Caulobacter sp. S6]
MTRALALALVAIAVAAAPPALAVEAPKPGAVDPRIRTLPYDADQLVLLRGQLGFQMMVEFASDERIENVSIGDALAWQVTPNKRANLLFLKPLSAGAVTNMTVVTDQRRYAFELETPRSKPARNTDRTYVVQFVYAKPPAAPPAPPAAAPAQPVRANTRYSYLGGRALLPSVVFDDQHFTYFRWPEATPTPAIFAVAGKGGESLVNYGVRDGYLVVEQIAPRFVLRNGPDSTTVINDGWREPDPGPEAPKPHVAANAKATEIEP